MKNNHYIFITILAFAAICYAITAFMRNSRPAGRHHFKIALLSPAIHPSIEKIEKAYISTLTNSPKATYTVTTFNGSGDGQRLSLFANRAVDSDFDAIVTIGTSTTLLIKNLLLKRAGTTPQIFTAVSRPETMGISQQIVDQKVPHLTGVLEENDLGTHIDIVCKMLPTAHRFLLIYCPTGGSSLEEDKKLVEKKLTDRGRSCRAVAIFSPAEIPTKTTEAIKQADVVMILKDNIVVSGLDGLLKLCNRFEKPLIASDLDSVDRGALSALGVYEAQFGVQGAELTRQILEEGKKPEQLPFAHAGRSVLKLNGEQCARHHIDAKVIEFIRAQYTVETI